MLGLNDTVSGLTCPGIAISAATFKSGRVHPKAGWGKDPPKYDLPEVKRMLKGQNEQRRIMLKKMMTLKCSVEHTGNEPFATPAVLGTFILPFFKLYRVV